MIIQVKELKDKPGKVFSYFFQEHLQDLEELEMLSYQENKDSPVNVRINACYQDNKVYVSGNLKAWVVVECSRCLTVVEKEIGGDFWEEFQLASGEESAVEENEGETGEDDYQLSREAADRLVIKGDTLDLREFTRQLYIVFQEWKPLCSEDCRGICAGCGTNLNESSCSCTNETIDPRLAPLQQLKSGDKTRRD